MTTSRAPAARAAAAFSAKPPGAPPSLVTNQRASYCFNSASFSAWVKGPCMAMMLRAGMPAAAQASRAAWVGSTRANSRAPPRCAKAGSSFMPVASRTPPSVPSSRRAAAGASGAVRASPGRGLAGRSSRRYPTPARAQAARMFSLACRA